MAVHRGTTATFTPDTTTLIGETLIDHIIDPKPLADAYYSIILKSGDARSNPFYTKRCAL